MRRLLFASALLLASPAAAQQGGQWPAGTGGGGGPYTITGESLGSTTFNGAYSTGITVTTTGNATQTKAMSFAFSTACSNSGAGNSSFGISGFTLSGTPSTGSYAVCIAATTSDASNSPFPVGFTISGTGGTDTLDPSNSTSSITLSNGNLTASYTGNNADASVRALNSHSSGKYYFEVTTSTSASSFVLAWGLAESSFTTNGGFAGSGTTATTFRLNNDNSIPFFSNGSQTLATDANGGSDVIGLAVDLGAGTMWVRDITRRGCSGWDSAVNGGTDNPATGAGGFSSGLTGTQYPVLSFYDSAANTQSLTINFGATSFSCSAPSGFSAWN